MAEQTDRVTTALAESIARVRQRISEAASRASRSPEEITLVAVSKTVPADIVRRAVELGLADLGENRVQEAESKFAELGPIARWHLVGHLQTNKVARALKIFDIIHSVDSYKLARELDKRAGEAGKEVEVLVEVNCSGEESKYGIDPSETEQLVGQILEMEHLRFSGLMTIGPLVDDPEKARPAFTRLRELKDKILPLVSGRARRCLLSMGMTNDFEVAIEEGADLVRIGTAIFGPRSR